MIVDPLIRMHGVQEQDNNKMDAVMQVFSRLADVHDCSIEVVHHSRKLLNGSDQYDAQDIRGASAISCAVRSARVMKQMSTGEAADYALTDLESYSYFRMVRAKGNNASRSQEVWRHFVSVKLPNRDELTEEDGDDVGVIESWDPPGQGAPSETMRANEAMHDKLFLDLLVKFTLAGRVVNDRLKGHYAPRLFAKEKEAKLAKVGPAHFEHAMRRLIDGGKVRLEQYGSPSDDKWRLEVVR
jgi:hypothetical protein